MQKDGLSTLQKIKKVSEILRTICTCLLVFVALITVVSVISLSVGVGAVTYSNLIPETSELMVGTRLLIAGACGLVLGALLKCFYHLRRLFGNYARGEIFTRESVGELRNFGMACLLWGVLNFVWAISLSLTLSPHPEKSFEAHFDSLAIGAVLVAIAWFMNLAVELKEENELTI
jgi:uncharacterized membrane protein YciS (DUF1049 family)